MRKTLTISMIALLLAGGAAWAGGPVHDTFSVTLQGDNEYVSGGGTGWSAAGGEGDWIYYGQTDWWNQWFYNDPPDETRWKEISYDISVDSFPIYGFGSLDITVDIALNWSTVDFPQTGPGGPPPMPEQEQFIERHVIYSGSELTGPIVGDYVIPDYNPEWVSIDVRVYAWEYFSASIVTLSGGGFGAPEPVDVVISGDIWHECVPEPATIGLLIMGGLVFLRHKHTKGARL